MAGRQKRCLWAVLSVSFLTIMGTQVATPILGELGNYFSGAPETQIKLIYTVVSLASFFMSFITGTLIRRKKEATLAGIACFVVGGVACVFADHLALLIFFRFLTGVGIGLISPLSSSLISDLTEAGEQRSRYLGLAGTVAQMGSVLATVLSGFLASIHWRLAFSLYGIGIAGFFAVLFLVPKSAPAAKEWVSHQKIPGAIWLLALLNLMFGIVFSSSFTNLSLRAAALGIPSGQSGIAISMAALGATLFSAFTPVFMKRLGRGAIPALWGMIALLFVGLALAGNVYGMGACMFGMGVFGGIFSVCINMLATRRASEQTSARYLSLVNAASMLGEFLCPMLFSALGQVMGSGDIVSGFFINAAEAGILALLTALYLARTKRRAEG